MDNLRRWSFRFFMWLVETKVRNLDGDDRILYLAHRLMDETERQGYDSVFNGTLKSIGVHHHTDIGVFAVSCNTSEGPWEIRETIPQ